MNKLTLLIVALALSISAPAFAHDMAAMGDMDGDTAPNAMGGQMGMGAHMVMTPSRPQTPQDVERAHDVMNTLRRALVKYHDSPRGARRRATRFFCRRCRRTFTISPTTAPRSRNTWGIPIHAFPGSLLYVKNSSGDYVLVGAMYSAPADYTPDQLDAIIPLSVAHWHAHTNICLPNGVTLNDVLRGDVHGTQVDMPGMLPVSSSPAAPGINQRLGFLADGRFGFTGKIADAATAKPPAATCSSKHSAGWSTSTRSTATT